MPKPSQNLWVATGRRVWLPWLLAVGMVVLLVAILWRQQAAMASAFTAALGADGWWMFTGFVFSLLTYLWSYAVLQAAVSRRLPLWPALLLQPASAFAGRVTPGNIGSILLGLQFLRRSGLSVAQAAARVSLTRLCGLLSTLCLLPVLAAWHGVGVTAFQGLSLGWISSAVAGIAVLVRLAVHLNRSVRSYFLGMVRELATIQDNASAIPLLGYSLLLTATFGLCLYASLQAVGVTVPFTAAILLVLAGSAAGSASPTPGGLGATEAAMTGSLLLFGVSADAALAGVLVYRLLTYWLPIVYGFVCFRWLMSSGYIYDHWRARR